MFANVNDKVALKLSSPHGLVLKTKVDGNPVASSDSEVEDKIIWVVLAVHPDGYFLGEEIGSKPQNMSMNRR